MTRKQAEQAGGVEAEEKEEEEEDGVGRKRTEWTKVCVLVLLSWSKKKRYGA
jgi:hypothetical protein